MLVRIVAPHMVCGIVVENGHVTEAAPIVKYMAEQRWSADRARAYIKRRGWTAHIVKEATWLKKV